MAGSMKAIDLFAGLGGFSAGAELAGVNVVWAANHWQAAVNIHAANHPGAEHACQDLQQTNWRDVPAHDLLMASPCCQGHSRARGKTNGNPQHDSSRSTAWAVVSAAEYHRPEFALIENVPEFTEWSLYPAWCAAMDALGYCLTPTIVDAADHGAPQHRERLFVIAVRAKHPLMLHLPKREHVPASSFVDFEAGSWQPIEKPGRATATLARVGAGRASFGDRFIMPYYGKGSGLTGRSLGRPVGSITTRDRWGIVDGGRTRMFSKQECRAAMGFPAGYKLPDQHRLAVHMLGNAVCPPAARDVINALRAAA
jgi:DNA (cytosine-5)-methyltransferase 1